MILTLSGADVHTQSVGTFGDFTDFLQDVFLDNKT